MSQRIQRKRSKGWKLPPNAIYVGRPTVWGNPFTAHDEEWKGEKVENKTLVLLYEVLLSEMFGINGKRKQTKEQKELLEAFLEPLRGKDLACWCSLDQPCHADVLLQLIVK
jgi:hypothetical protein